jgi:hypothetical protein
VKSFAYINESQIFRIKKNSEGYAEIQSKKYSNTSVYDKPLVAFPMPPDLDNQSPASKLKKFMEVLRPTGGDEEYVGMNLVEQRGYTQYKGRDGKMVCPIARLKKTVSKLEKYNPVGWSDEARSWWENYISENEALAEVYGSGAKVPCQPPKFQTCEWEGVETSTDTDSSRDDEIGGLVTAFEVELLGEAHHPLSYTRRSEGYVMSRNADPKDMHEGELVAVSVARDASQLDRERDVSTPFSVGKILKLVDASKIQVHWYGAEMGSSKRDDPWMKWRWYPRYDARNKTKKVMTVINRYQCGLLAYGFTLLTAGPAGGLKVMTVRLIREQMEGECLSEEEGSVDNSEMEEDLSGDEDVPLCKRQRL